MFLLTVAPNFQVIKLVVLQRRVKLTSLSMKSSGVDKAAFCVCTRKFTASTLENLS